MYVITDETVLTFVFFRDVIRDVIRDCVLSSDYGDGGGFRFVVVGTVLFFLSWISVTSLASCALFVLKGSAMARGLSLWVAMAVTSCVESVTMHTNNGREKRLRLRWLPLCSKLLGVTKGLTNARYVAR